MIDLALKAIDRAIALLKGRIDDKRKFVQEQVAPVFSEMEVIHKNYIQSFTDLIQLAEDACDRDVIIENVLQKKMEFEHIRVKAHSFAKVARESRRVPDQAKGFFNAIYYYFSEQDEVLEGNGYYSRFSSVLEILSTLHHSDDITKSKEMLIKHFNNCLVKTRKNWERLTEEYSQCKLEMLR